MAVYKVQRCEGKEGVGGPIRGHLGEPAEKDAENDHSHERLDDGPRHPDEGLAVANFDVSPDQEVENLAVFP